jgi:SnoaL-like protein
VAAPGPAPTARPPGRALLRLAGVLSQLTCGACLLIGTIALVLVQQNKTGNLGSVGAWLATAMAGLVFGGLIYRGGLISTLVAAAIDASFGAVLITLAPTTLRKLLKILPAPDVETIGDALHIAGFAMIGVAVICLVAVPQGLRFARWFRAAAATRTAMSTAPGFPPPPVPARGSVYIIPADEGPSRRRLYMVLGGLAIGVGAGIGVLVSSTRPAATPAQTDPAIARPGSGSGAGSNKPHGATLVIAPPDVAAARDAGVPRPGDAGGANDARLAASDPPADAGAGAGAAIAPAATVASLLVAEHTAIARADARALAALMTPTAFGFGIDADEVAEGRAAVAAQILRDLGDPPAGGFTVTSRSPAIGEDRGHAWIAEELEVGGPGREPRRFAVTALAAAIGGTWTIVALSWATPVSDATAERLAILKTLPMPQPIPDRHDGSGELDKAVRAAFASRAAFAEARSERPDAFNYGSGGERAHGGVAIKRIFAKLKAQIRLHDGARVVAGSQWDPAQHTAPWIGWAAVNVDFTAKTRAATEVTQTFRVLAIMLDDGAGWKIVQTQWSNGGPIR